MTLQTGHEPNRCPDREVIVRGDRNLSYEKICEVLATLSDVGFTRVGLVTERP